ncbi:MAG: hypothetical protein C3F02_04935 [Parcubacteria group bacterium]|nr:MAG: hypothetical protein C3F02_04935 [Parcubacteria group bacterium]
MNMIFVNTRFFCYNIDMYKYFFFLLLLLFLLIPFSSDAQDIDTDGDGLSDLEETTIYFTDPKLADTDGDGFDDQVEIGAGYSPRFGGKKKLIQVDSDKDYLNDLWELTLGTGLMNPDSDGDKYLDGTEVAAGYDPLNSEKTKLDKLIKVDLKTQHLDYYFGDKLFGSFPISGGVKSMPTPIGDFTILDKVPVKHYGGGNFDYPNTKWNLHFVTKQYRYYIHGAYWHNNFGQPMSHGCVNVSYENMEPLYWFAQVGTKVEIK